MPPALSVIALLLVLTLCYVAVCAVSPFGPCRACDGLGFQLTTNRRGQPRRGRDCRRCKGAGRRLRLGRRLHNAWQRTYHNGTH